MLRVGRDPRVVLLDVAVAPDALIEEARRRRRRRWGRRGIVAVVVVVAGVVAGLLASRDGDIRIVRESVSTPFANVSAFAGHGELAFVSRGALWVLADGSLRRMPVPRGDVPVDPTFSADGRWLAWLASPTSANGWSPMSELWIARGDGHAAHAAANRVDQFVGWSPHADLVAIVTETVVRFTGAVSSPREPQATGVAVVAAPGRRRQLFQLPPPRGQPFASVYDAVWSPTGSEVAVSVDDEAGSTIRAYPVGGGSPTTWFAIGTRQPLSQMDCGSCGGRQVIASVAGWFPRQGIVFWSFCCGMVHNNDETPLLRVATPGARPQLIAQTLSDKTTDALAVAPNGALAVVDSVADGREYGEGKIVAYCAAGSGACLPVPSASVWSGPDHQRCVTPKLSPRQCVGRGYAPPGQPGSGVTLDPSWSPDSELLAYVRAPVALTGGNPDAAWYAAHTIYTWNPHTGATRRVGEVDGASVPTWSHDGRDLLYERNNGLTLAPVSGARPTRIAYPLLSPSQLHGLNSVNYYGQIPWTAQFTWWSP